MKAIIIILTLLICAYKDSDNKLALEDPHTIKLNFEHTNSTKSIWINSTIALKSIDTQNFWCSGSEPICKKVANDSITISVCHKAIREIDKEYYQLRHSEEQILTELNETLKSRFESEQLKYIEKLEFETFGIDIEHEEEGEKHVYGYIQKMTDSQIFTYNYTVVSEEEFLNLEFVSKKPKISPIYMKEEIRYIIEKLRIE